MITFKDKTRWENRGKKIKQGKKYSFKNSDREILNVLNKKYTSK